ncbi:IS110 family transposase [Spirosoma sp. RP8]|uniref:IS110 family transposase n=2 Tax=Spirosoma liriopis TaxID=2937440 RepID=A0ABT0HTP4_9BACT|nr:IS110 family transposase [Spirosoma liriopis]
MLIFTGNFTRFTDAKKLASYAGVAPFAYESDSSVRGRTKVSRMANTNRSAEAIETLATYGRLSRC